MPTPVQTADFFFSPTGRMPLQLGVLELFLLAQVAQGCDSPAPSSDPPESETLAAKNAAAPPKPDAPAAESSGGSATVSMRINRAPAIDKMIATPSPLELNVQTSLHATASDADGDSLTLEWSSTCEGHFVGSGPSPLFTLAVATASASCTFHVMAQDGAGGRGEGDLTVPVGSPVAIETGAPVVGLVFQSTDTVEPGQTVTLGIDATDASGTCLVYQWSAAVGTFADQQDLQPQSQITGRSTISWTAPAQADSSWDVTVIVSNGAGADTSYVFNRLQSSR